jgi:hypothetical protein
MDIIVEAGLAGLRGWIAGELPVVVRGRAEIPMSDYRS